MLEGQLPQYFDPKRYAEQELELLGQVAVGSLPRIRDLESGHDKANKSVDVSLKFFRDEEGLYVITGNVGASLALTCQRCLEPVETQVLSAVSVALVWSEEQAKQLPSAYDPWFITEEKMKLATLLEEELLLAMPIVATHEECEFAIASINDPIEESRGEQRQNNPFAVLECLKQDAPNKKT